MEQYFKILDEDTEEYLVLEQLHIKTARTLIQKAVKKAVKEFAVSYDRECITDYTLTTELRGFHVNTINNLGEYICHHIQVECKDGIKRNMKFKVEAEEWMSNGVWGHGVGKRRKMVKITWEQPKHKAKHS